MDVEVQSQELTCQELVEIVTDYLEGSMSAAERERFDAHLKTCRGCTHYLEQMRQTIAVVGTLTEDIAPVEARDGLLEIFRDWKRTQIPPEHNHE
jgi:anti-sigma factor RsiW